jgi:hypothetical protein
MTAPNDALHDVKAMVFEALKESINGKHTDCDRDENTVWLSDDVSEWKGESINLDCFATVVSDYFAAHYAQKAVMDGKMSPNEARAWIGAPADPHAAIMPIIEAADAMPTEGPVDAETFKARIGLLPRSERCSDEEYYDVMSWAALARANAATSSRKDGGE